MKAARLHAFDAALELDESQRPRSPGRSTSSMRVGGAGSAHRPAYPAGMVQRHHPRGTARHPRARERRLVEAVGPQVANLGVGDAVVLHPRMSCGMCRACRMGRDMHCAEFIFSGATSGQVRRVPPRPALRRRQAATRGPAQRRRRPRRCRRDRLPRGQEGRFRRAVSGRHGGGHRRRRGGPHWDQVPAGPQPR